MGGVREELAALFRSFSVATTIALGVVFSIFFGVLTGFGIVIYYAVIMAWCFCYLAYSLELSWQPDAASFFTKTFLEKSGSPAQLGGVRWPILVGLLI